MPDLDHDIDDLLRKAAENYSLKAASDRWQEIAQNIIVVQVPVKKKKSGFRKYVAVVLMLILFLFFADFLFHKDHPREFGQSTVKFKSPEENMNKTPDNVSRISPTTVGGIKGSKSASKLLTGDVIIESNAHKDLDQAYLSSDLFAASSTRAKVISLSPFKRTIEAVKISGLKNEPAQLELIKNDTADSLESTWQSNKKHQAKNGFIYGLSAGTGFTNIKSQSINKASFEYGISAGYRFNQLFSVETGILFSNKYYQTSGKYFSLKTVGNSMPSGMNLMDVSGRSRLLQLPLHFRFDLVNKHDHRFFAATGISTFILTKERNSYHMELNGSESMMYSTYTSRHGYFAGSLDFTAGVEKDIGRKFSYRIEPYFQLPLKGIGVGELQLKSAGLRIALTRSTK